ncbi:hypothetical protein L9F63_007497 [Diploptera punctata]|uniref:Transmembrane protein 26 n=1 Tax=Diploptera punctata TaxID=6984 RepID=A0AAD8E3K8_DIPPU|nr:hypothetical protein L9F63_007497 [Diploptera punctata]
MASLLATVKAILTRLVFGAHGVVAIWQVTNFKKNLQYWYLCAPIIMLMFEGIFTLTIKRSQEWKWFCPSVFLYLSSVVPAIWLLELDKLERRIKARQETRNLTAITVEDLRGLEKIMGGQLLPQNLQITTDTWVTLIEQFLMLILIIGRWMLPKGELTRDQLSQLLLVYIGTAADIIEFFDSFKDDKIAQEPLLVLLTLAIWSWSLLQFTMCGAILLNILLQDAPFLGFRLLLIIQFRIISYMNVFFTCKNTLVILLQLYRLYVVHSETNKQKKMEENKKKKINKQKSKISIIAMPDTSMHLKRGTRDGETSKSMTVDEVSDLESLEDLKRRQSRRVGDKKKTAGGRRYRQDTGYSTASSSHGSSAGKKQKSKATMTSRSDLRNVHQREKRHRDSASSQDSDTSPPAPRRSTRRQRADEEERV